MKIQFGNLPDDAKNLLTYTTQINFAPWRMEAPRWFSAWARDEHGAIAGVFCIEFKYPWEGYINVAVLDHRCMTRRTLRAIFTAAFSQAVRLTAEIEPHNRRALKQVQRMGFQFEGTRRLGLEGTRDVLCFGMLKNECRYLPASPAPHIPDRIVGDTEAAGERGARLFGSPDLMHLSGRQLDVARHAPRAVPELVRHVALTGVPAEVPPVDARSMSALVGGLVGGRG
jgi:hypothetical protein